VEWIPSSNIHEALGRIAVCCSFGYPGEMKTDGDALKPLRQLQLDLNTSVYSDTLNYSIPFLSPSTSTENGLLYIAFLD
jgi:hypothetical protein